MFHVVAPLTQTGLNADGLPIAQSVIANSNVEVTLLYEMLDTIVGTPMGTKLASATFLHSDRCVLKQSCSIKKFRRGNDERTALPIPARPAIAARCL